jgi:hypothetical protein
MCNPIVNPSEKAAYLSRVLFVLMWCEIALAILYFTSVIFIVSGILELMLAVLLYLASRSFIQGHVIVYLFIQMFNLITIVCYLGGLLQHKLMFKPIKAKIVGQTTNFAIYSEVVCLLAFAFYIICIIFGFLSYREFKALYMEQHMNRRFQDNEARDRAYR